MEPEFITVVGGLGGMGAFMVGLFEEAGCRVNVADVSNGPIDWKSAADADVVILAVPIPAVGDVLKKIGPYTREDGVVIDICSLKQGPIDLMKEHCRGEIIGSHPLFGPSAPSVLDQTFFVSPVKSEKWFRWFKSFLQARGARVVQIAPEKHDRLMACVQVLRHLMLFSFGLSLTRLGFDLDDSLPISGEWFSKLVGMLGSQLKQAPDLYADLALNNPESKKVLEAFVQAASDIFESVSSGDKNAVLKLFNEVSANFNVLNHFSRPLAADDFRIGYEAPF